MSDQKPELYASEAAYLIKKLDTNIPLDDHNDRNNFTIVLQKLIQISNWKLDPPNDR